MDISPEKKALLLQGIQSVVKEQTDRGNPFFIIDLLLAPKEDQQRIIADIANAIAQAKFVEIQHMRSLASALTPQPPPPPPPTAVREIPAAPAPPEREIIEMGRDPEPEPPPTESAAAA